MKQEFKKIINSILLGAAIGIPLSLFAINYQKERREVEKRYIIEQYEKYEQEPQELIRWKQEI